MAGSLCMLVPVCAWPMISHWKSVPPMESAYRSLVVVVVVVVEQGGSVAR